MAGYRWNRLLSRIIGDFHASRRDSKFEFNTSSVKADEVSDHHSTRLYLRRFRSVRNIAALLA